MTFIRPTASPTCWAAQVAARPPNWVWPIELTVAAAKGYLIQGPLDRGQVERIARELLADRVVERTVVAAVGEAALIEPPPARDPHARPMATRQCAAVQLVHVLPKPGVMDPVAQSVLSAIADFGIRAEAVRTLKKYWIGGLPAERLDWLAAKVLANDAIEQVIVGPLAFRRLEVGAPYEFRLHDRAASGRWTTRPCERLSLRRAALSLAGRDADDPGPFPGDRPRSDRRRTGNHRPDLERALQPQDAHRPHPLSRRPAASGASTTCSARRFSPPRRRFAARPGRTTGA